MKYNQLLTRSTPTRRRVGRGIAAGQGKTAGRGTKGQNSRAGSHRKPGFEGGQNPLMQRLPKLHGFRSYQDKAELVYTHQLTQFGSKIIDTTLLAEAGFISSPFVRVKLLKKGELSKKVIVKLSMASAAAIAEIEKAGGSFSKVERPARPAAVKKTK